MRLRKPHTYRGETLNPCVWNSSTEAGYRWYLVCERDDYVLDEDCSPRFRTLADAREEIDQAQACETMDY